ncbi:coil containing protein [Vibrio phage 1.193.O._10N.286.52.C6]|nr:coil containing protein [Vibrio phage 1.193.O._10N.286.52.C6]
MLLAHKVELRPSSQQEQYLQQLCGVSRHLWNQLLHHFSGEDVKWSKKSAREKMYSLREEYLWYSDYSANILRCSIDNLDNAYKKFFKTKKGYPKFKSKHQKQSFNIYESQKFKVDGRDFRIEKFNKSKKSKPIKMGEKLRFEGKVKQANVSFQNGKWFCSFLIEVEVYKGNFDQHGSVGVDLGIKDLATLSDGTTFQKSNKLSLSLKKLVKLQRKLSKKKRETNRYAKAKLSIVKLHFRIKKQREALLHNVSDELTSKYKTICLEDLAVSSMTKGKGKKFNRMVLDVGMYELRRQLEYKSLLRGVDIYFVDRYYPSSKLHYECGFKNETLKLGESTWKCGGCGQLVDRDLNAAKNILTEGLRLANN